MMQNNADRIMFFPSGMSRNHILYNTYWLAYKANCFISGDRFILNATTGTLIVNGTLDREIAEFYHLQIIVRIANSNPYN